MTACLKLLRFLWSKNQSVGELNSSPVLFWSQGTLEKSPVILSQLCILSPSCTLSAIVCLLCTQLCSNHIFGDCCPRNCELLGKTLATFVKAFLIEVTRSLQHELCGYLREKQPRKQAMTLVKVTSEEIAQTGWSSHFLGYSCLLLVPDCSWQEHWCPLHFSGLSGSSSRTQVLSWYLCVTLSSHAEGRSSPTSFPWQGSPLTCLISPLCSSPGVN